MKYKKGDRVTLEDNAFVFTIYAVSVEEPKYMLDDERWKNTEDLTPEVITPTDDPIRRQLWADSFMRFFNEDVECEDCGRYADDILEEYDKRFKL